MQFPFIKNCFFSHILNTLLHYINSFKHECLLYYFFNTHPKIFTTNTDLCLRNVIQHANTRLLLLESTKLNLMLNLWSWFQSYYMPNYQGSFTFLNKCCIPLDITILDFPQCAFSFKSNTLEWVAMIRLRMFQVKHGCHRFSLKSIAKYAIRKFTVTLLYLEYS